MGHNRQRDSGATATPQNRNLGIQQEHLHGITPDRSRRGTAVSLSGNLSLNLKLQCSTGCREQFYLKNADLKNFLNMDYMQESRGTTAYYVNAIAVQQVALQHVACQSRCLSGPM